MRSHACIVLVIAAYASAATIQIQAAEKKLPATPFEPAKETNPLDNVSSEQELLDSANTIKDVENNLRVKAVDSIPVKVIVDPVDDDATDFKRVEVDLNNPGEPQRQEHDTQSPESFGHEQQIVATVKQTVSDTQYALKQGFQGVSQGLQDWIANNEQLSSIQESIQGLQQSFTSQITKLNDTIQSYWNNQGSPDAVQTEQKKKPQFDSVENNLKNLENNFQISVKALSEGVQVFATLRDDNEKPTTPPNNLFLQYLQLFQQTVAQGFNNVTQAVQNYVQQNNTSNNASNGGILQGINNGFQNIFSGGPNPAPDAQSDEGATQRPTIWQGIQSTIQNVINPSQSQNTAVQNDQPSGPPNGPFAQAIQNNPFVQGIVNFIQPNKPAAQPAKPAEQPAPQGSNVVPAPTDTKLESDAQQPAEKPEQPAPAVLTNGPIKNIIQNNPIVQSISGAVQRFQSSINGNSEKPRDTVKEEKQPVKEEQQNVKEEQQVVKEEQQAVKEEQQAAKTETKGHGGSGDSSDSSGVATKADPEKPVKVEESIPEEPKKEILEEKKIIKETEKTEAS